MKGLQGLGCLVVVACLLSGGWAEPALGEANWVAHSPGTLTCRSVEAGSLGNDVRRIEFRPEAAHGGDYWCNAGLELQPPQRANTVRFNARASDGRTVVIKLLDSAGRAAYYNLRGASTAQRVTLRTAQADGQEGPAGGLSDIAAVQFIFSNSWFKPGETFALDIGDIAVDQVDAPQPGPLRHPNWMPLPRPKPVPGYRVETCVWNVWTPGSGWGTGDAEFNGFDQPRGLQTARDIQNHFAAAYGRVGMDMPYIHGENGKALCDNLAKLGGLPMSEGHNCPPQEWLRDHNATVRAADGATPGSAHVGDLTSSHDMTNPEVLRNVQDRLLESARAGAKAWRTVDYVWPWEGGGMRWGFSESAIKRWREDLAGTDGGIEITERGRRRTVHFMEYFRSYHGYTPTPEQMGIASWDDYAPPKPGEPETAPMLNRRKAYALLFHYEWVKFANEQARPSAALGMLVQPICNPEAFDNGTDLAWLMRGAFVRGFCAEWWGGAGVIIPNYYNGSYYDAAARANGKEIVNLGESAAAGGSPFYGKAGRPHYWDNQANFLVCYSQAGSFDFKAKHDQYLATTWSRFTNPADRQYASFTAFSSAWGGFLQARNDRVTKPRSGVLAVSQRSVTASIDAFDVCAGSQPYNLARSLVALNYTHDGAAFPLEGIVSLDSYRTIVYCPYEAPMGAAGKVAAWVAARAGRAVVTHSFVPARFSAPAPAPQGVTDTLQTGGQERLFGLTHLHRTELRSGTLASSVPAFRAALGPLLGARVNLAGGLYETRGGRTLVTLGGRPLVSEHRVGKGRVIYLHGCPPAQPAGSGTVETHALLPADDMEALERRLMEGVMRYLGHRPAAVTPAGVSALAYDAPGGNKVFITIAPGATSQVLQGGEAFRVFQAQGPETHGTASLLAGTPTHLYTLTDLITRRHWTTRSDAHGYVTVKLDGWNLRGIRVGH